MLWRSMTEASCGARGGGGPASNCESLWLRYAYCVQGPPSSTSTSATSTTSSGPVSANTVGHCVQLQQLLYSLERRLVLQDRDRVQRHVPAALFVEPGDWRSSPVAVGWVCHLRRGVFVIEDSRQSGLSLLHRQAYHSKAPATKSLGFIELS